MSIENKKIFNTRVQLKYSTWNEWQAKENEFIPLRGEICIVAVPQDQDPSVSINEKTQTPPAILFKVGDGVSTLKQLPWASGLAADVAEWAKAKDRPEYKASDIKVTDTTLLNAPNVEDALSAIWTKIADLTGEEAGTGTIGQQIAAGIKAMGSASVSATGKYVTGVSVDEDGKLAISETSLPDYTDVYAAKTTVETLRSDFDNHIEDVKEYDGRITAAANAAAAANENADTRVLKSDFTSYTQTTDGAIQAINNTIAALDSTYATDAELATAIAGVNEVIAALDGTYATDEALATAIEGVNTTIAALDSTYATDAELKTVKEGLEAVIAALDNTYATDAELKEVKEGLEGAIADINGLAATHVTKEEFTAEQAARTAAEAQVLADAKDYADEVKEALLGDDLTTTFDTLKAVQDWVDEHGAQATDLATALTTETSERKAADAAEVEARNAAITEAVNAETEARKTAIATEVEARNTAIGNAISTEVTNRNNAISAAIANEATARGTAITEAVNAEATARATAIADAVGAEATARGTAIANAKTELEGKISESEAAAKKHADDEIAKIKLNTLTQDEGEYVIFYCGDANTFIDNPSTVKPEEVPAE